MNATTSRRPARVFALKSALDRVGVLFTDHGYATREIENRAGGSLARGLQTRSTAIFLYYSGRRQVPVRLQAFIEFLRHNLQDS